MEDEEELFKRDIARLLLKTEFEGKTEYLARELWNIKLSYSNYIDYGEQYNHYLHYQLDICKALLSIKSGRTKTISINDAKGVFDILVPNGFEQLLETEFSRCELNSVPLSYANAQLLLSKDDKWLLTYWKKQLTVIIKIINIIVESTFEYAYQNDSKTKQLQFEQCLSPILEEITELVQQWKKNGCTYDEVLNHFCETKALSSGNKSNDFRNLFVLIIQDYIHFLERKRSGNSSDLHKIIPTNEFIEGIKEIIINAINDVKHNKYEVNLVDILTKQYLDVHSYVKIPITTQLIESNIKALEESLVPKRGAPLKPNKDIEVLGFLSFFNNENVLWVPIPDKMQPDSKRVIYEALKLAGIINDNVEFSWQGKNRKKYISSYMDFIHKKAIDYHNNHSMP